jgi:hypothetical protein
MYIITELLLSMVNTECYHGYYWIVIIDGYYWIVIINELDYDGTAYVVTKIGNLRHRNGGTCLWAERICELIVLLRL